MDEFVDDFIRIELLATLDSGRAFLNTILGESGAELEFEIE